MFRRYFGGGDVSGGEIVAIAFMIATGAFLGTWLLAGLGWLAVEGVKALT